MGGAYRKSAQYESRPRCKRSGSDGTPAKRGEVRHEVARGQFVEERVVVHVEHPFLEHLRKQGGRRESAASHQALRPTII